MSLTDTQWNQFSGVFPRPPFDPAAQPEENLVPVAIDLHERVGALEGEGPGDAIEDIPDSEAQGTTAVGDPPTQAEFDDLVNNFNTLVNDHNAAVAALNGALQVLRDHNLLAAS